MGYLTFLAAAIVSAFLVGMSAFPQAQAHAQTASPVVAVSVPSGSYVFHTYCASCHGATAKGDGPLADSMKRRPADLTEIAKRNAGVFPSDRVFQSIDGRKPVKGHGGPDMPVWGDAFARASDSGGEASVRDRIQSLVVYLESIQTKITH